MEPPGDDVSGGYVVTCRVPRPDWCSGERLPDVLLSADAELCPHIPDTWAFAWTSDRKQDRLAAAERFGLCNEPVADMGRWADRALKQGALGWPDVFYCVETARDFARRFIPETANATILGVSLDRNFRSYFLDDAMPGSMGEEASGRWQAIRRDEAPAEGGRSLGFELLAFQGCAFESWLMSDLEGKVVASLGVAANPCGLITSRADAIRAATYCSRPDVAAYGRLWLPWLLREYGI